MLEAILSAAILVGSVQVSPNVLAEQYIVETNNGPVVVEVQEEME
jgi:hypothetical protein